MGKVVQAFPTVAAGGLVGIVGLVAFLTSWRLTNALVSRGAR